ncbi:MAG: Nif3-like dinuclear metal center hexameric protein [Phycisphaerales bacterium]|nr:Nif3-like dinuclear metal center hexameric protein [Phycisphaerales bacterium]
MKRTNATTVAGPEAVPYQVSPAASTAAGERRPANLWYTGQAGPYPLETVAEFLDELSPPALAEPWDNAGLLSACPGASVARVLVALDLTATVLHEAMAWNADLLVCYHPPIFQPIKTLVPQPNAPCGNALLAHAAGIWIYSPHTALDTASGGTNDALAAALNLNVTGNMRPSHAGEPHLKLVTFIPENEVEKVADAVFLAGAGRVGQNSRYHHCSFRTPGTGTFFGEESTHPTVGEAGRMEFVREVRFETVLPVRLADAVVAALRTSHPYEEPAFDLLVMYTPPDATGTGKIAHVKLALQELAQQCKTRLGLLQVQVVGEPSRHIETVALIAGSAGRLALDGGDHPQPDCLITGELKHHDMLAYKAAGIATICLGHGSSELPVLHRLRERLTERFSSLEIRVSTAHAEPFTMV